MLSAEDFLAKLHMFADNHRGDVLRAWMQDHTEVPVVAATLYLFLVLYVPQNIMAHRNPLNLRFLNILWNLLLTVFSICGAYYCTPRLLEMVFAKRIRSLVMMNETDLSGNSTELDIPGSLYASACVWHDEMFFNGPVGFWVGAFVLSKIPEMIDTVFLVFQKKPVIFLHWYHHVTVMLFCWHAYAYTISSGLWFATMNYCVHSIMYFYYFVCACGFRKVIRPIAPFITTLQLLQMVVGTFIVVYTYVMKHVMGKECGVNDPNLRMGLMMYVSYLVLFAQLFYRSYMKPSPRLSSSMRNGEKKMK